MMYSLQHCHQKLIAALLLIFLSFGCSSSNNEEEKMAEEFVKKNLPELSALEQRERMAFEKSLIFDQDGKLQSWDSEVIKKHFSNEESVGISLKLLTLAGKIENSESAIVVTSDGQFLTDGDKTESSLLEAYTGEWVAPDTVGIKPSLWFYSSVTCGHCTESFRTISGLAEKIRRETSLNVLFLFSDQHQAIKNYIQSPLFPTFGFVNFSNQILCGIDSTACGQALGIKNMDAFEEIFPRVFFVENKMIKKNFGNPFDKNGIKKELTDFLHSYRN
ncbi:hypothetical protein HR13_08490 [Porphyromonas gulae]|uniref:Thioredoxin domain-containing protein n=2 Tax=Porphyromonas gulae TaxID=111105 RepID=A0A0A2EH92_9PORP|nr:hypothetical protein HR09_00210 [Porphyromonas gulae]KGN78283.1 hypothetical protein HR13_08490 [Porphyromonas gulae]KGN85697.1 hypothetical protein HR15_09440 [Porphyromonas gulae]KKC51307.1 hypothetical protein HR10_04140 [Porphyromonas gulae]